MVHLSRCSAERRDSGRMSFMQGDLRACGSRTSPFLLSERVEMPLPLRRSPHQSVCLQEAGAGF